MEKILKIIEKTLMIFVIIGVAWITIQTIYGVGKAKGYVKGYESAIIENETRINQAYETGFEKCLEQF